MAEDNIPGTRVPETPIHRASLWLEDVKFGERRPTMPAEVQRMDDNDTSIWVFLHETGLPVTPEQLMEAASYYGDNLTTMTFGNRVSVIMPTPDGQATMDLRSVITSAWLDGFQHGAATLAGKRGQSNLENENEQRRD